MNQQDILFIGSTHLEAFESQVREYLGARAQAFRLHFIQVDWLARAWDNFDANQYLTVLELNEVGKARGVSVPDLQELRQRPPFLCLVGLELLGDGLVRAHGDLLGGHPGLLNGKAITPEMPAVAYPSRAGSEYYASYFQRHVAAVAALSHSRRFRRIFWVAAPDMTEDVALFRFGRAYVRSGSHRHHVAAATAAVRTAFVRSAPGAILITHPAHLSVGSGFSANKYKASERPYDIHVNPDFYGSSVGQLFGTFEKNMSKRLYLHIGTQKTGSSFLQHMLRINSARLSDSGISYVNYSPEYISSGNGDMLLDAIQARDSAGAFREVMDSYFGIQQMAILSSELLYTMGLDWDLAFERLTQCGIRTDLIIYFRNPVEFVKSSYSQQIKRHGYTGSLRSFIEQISADLYDGPLRKILAASQSTVYDMRLHIINYDSRRSELWKSFLQCCDLEEGAFEGQDLVVNASLNSEQLELHRLYNKLFPSDISGGFSDFLQEREMLEQSPQLSVTEAEYEVIKRKFAAPVEFVNQYVTGAPIRIVPPANFAVSHERVHLDEQGLEKLLAFLFSDKNRLEMLSGELNWVVQECEQVEPELRALYPEFNPVEYLVCNPELIRARVNPYRHFHEFGREEGRRFRLKDR